MDRVKIGNRNSGNEINMCEQKMNELKHLVVIADGSRRYALERGIPLVEAYRKGAKMLRNLLKWVFIDHDIPEFSFFGLSCANLRGRDKDELNAIFKVQPTTLNEFAEDEFFHRNKIKICVVGQKQLLPKEYVEAILNVETATNNYRERRFNILLAYSGVRDLEQAIEKTIKKGKKISLENIVANCSIQTPIDFVIRNANEKRISDSPFFLIQYTEYATTPCYFPELKKSEINNLIADYKNRKRTFGA